MSVHDAYENSLAAALTYDESTSFDPNFLIDRKGFWIGYVGRKQSTGTKWEYMHTESIPVYTNWGLDEPSDVYQV